MSITALVQKVCDINFDHPVSRWQCGVKIFGKPSVFILPIYSTTMLIERSEATESETDVSQTGGSV